MSKTRRKKNKESKRRFEAIKDLMSTFAMGTVAVVAAVTLIPSSPKAEVTKAIALNEEIIYQVNVTDKDNALDLSTLFVVLENQLEFYEQSISLGETSGYFDSLEPNTEYRLSVYGNKGFGQERLDTLSISTKDKIGGQILSVTPLETNFSISYLVDVSINDPNSKYTSMNLYYGYRWEEDAEILYSSIPIDSDRMSIELNDIDTHLPFHIYVEGTTIDGVELLDEIWVTPPFELSASLYIDYLNDKEIGFYLHGDLNVEDISYEMNIYEEDSLIRTDQVEITTNNHYGSKFIIDDLTPNTIYLFECIATYVNPQTLRQEQSIIYQEEITTLDVYSYTYSVETFDDYIEVTIVVTDPFHYFQLAFYESYDTSSEEDIYLNGQNYQFTANTNDKSVTFTIYKPTSSSYQITIGIRNEFNYSLTQIIEVINYE